MPSSGPDNVVFSEPVFFDDEFHSGACGPNQSCPPTAEAVPDGPPIHPAGAKSLIDFWMQVIGSGKLKFMLVKPVEKTTPIFQAELH